MVPRDAALDPQSLLNSLSASPGGTRSLCRGSPSIDSSETPLSAKLILQTALTIDGGTKFVVNCFIESTNWRNPSGNCAPNRDPPSLWNPHAEELHRLEEIPEEELYEEGVLRWRMTHKPNH